jgi:hypothetical protein
MEPVLVPSGIQPQSVVLKELRSKLSITSAVANSRFHSRVSSGIEETNRSVNSVLLRLDSAAIAENLLPG